MPHQGPNDPGLDDLEMTDPGLGAEPLPEPSAASVPAGPRKVKRPSSRPPGEDTLLSVPVPADRSEALFEERLTRVEMHLIDVDTRLRELETKKAHPKAGTREWILWCLLVLALAALYKAFFS